MEGWAERWSSFPAAHRKRCYQGLAGYGLLVLATAAWISVRAADTVRDWQGRIPSATAPIKSVYLTPQITDTTKEGAPQIVAPAPQQPVVDDGKTYITIIVTGLGLSSLATERAVSDLPPQVTLAFSPYAENVHAWISKAVSAHHETLMQLPMETSSYPEDDPGPRALSSRFSDQDNDDNLNWLLSQGAGSVGVLNMMGNRFMSDQRRLSSAFTTLRKNDAMFIESPGIRKSAAPGVAAETGLHFMEANLQIDASATDKDIRAQLDMLEKIARKHGYAIGVAQPYPLTLNILKSWVPELESRGIVLAPLRTVWKNKPHYEENDAQSSAGGSIPGAPPQSELRHP